MNNLILIIIGLLVIIYFRKKIWFLVLLFLGYLLSIKTDPKDYYNPSENDDDWRH